MSSIALAPMPRPNDLNEMPKILRDQLRELETWAQENRSDARKDAIRFWVLKIPAVIISASAGIFAYFKWEAGAVIASAIASICVLIDGLSPGGALRNSHYKAFLDLRKLQQSIQARWRVESWKATGEDAEKELAAKIIKNAQKEIERVATYLRDAESALGVKHE